MRVAVWTATVAMAVMLLSGVVLAETKTCRNNCQGTNGSDYLLGDGSNNEIYGLRGKDYVGGKAAADTLFGGTGNDEVAGGSGKDRMKGGSGVDTLLGRPGYDSLSDQPEKGSFAQQSSQHGSYQVQASRKPDRLLGGRGNDTIRARDGNRDIIRGGPGYDKAYVDRVDKVTGIEVERCPGGCTNPPGSGGTNPPGGGGTGGGPQQPKQCEDGKDNDNDGKVDFGTGANNDPGCDSLTDNTENTPPDAKNDELTTTENNSEGIEVLFNDRDDDGDTLTVTNVTDPINGTVPQSSWGPSDNIPTYTPDDCYDGRDSFKYTVSDGHGGTDKGTVKVTVDPDPIECPPPGPGPAAPVAN